MENIFCVTFGCVATEGQFCRRYMIFSPNLEQNVTDLRHYIGN